MDFASLGIVGVAAITMICYLVGMIAKATTLDNKWIPVVCGVCGLLLGILGLFVMPDFPAEDYITAAAVGAFSGLAATGVNQAVKQISNK